MKWGQSLDNYPYFLLLGDKRKYQRKTPFVLLSIYPFHGGRTTGFLAYLDDEAMSCRLRQAAISCASIQRRHTSLYGCWLLWWRQYHSEGAPVPKESMLLKIMIFCIIDYNATIAYKFTYTSHLTMHTVSWCSQGKQNFGVRAYVLSTQRKMEDYFFFTKIMKLHKNILY